MRLEEIANTPISDIQLRDPVRVKAGTALFDVVVRLRDQRRGSAIVESDDGILLGIFTERDLMLHVDHSDKQWHGIPVSEVMTQDPETVFASESLTNAITRMSEGGFRHLPVVDHHGHVINVLSIRDALAYIAEFFPEEFINLPPDPQHEASGRWGG